MASMREIAKKRIDSILSTHGYSKDAIAELKEYVMVLAEMIDMDQQQVDYIYSFLREIANFDDLNIVFPPKINIWPEGKLYPELRFPLPEYDFPFFENGDPPMLVPTYGAREVPLSKLMITVEEFERRSDYHKEFLHIVLTTTKGEEESTYYFPTILLKERGKGVDMVLNKPYILKQLSAAVGDFIKKEWENDKNR